MGRLFGAPESIPDEAPLGKLVIIYDGGCGSCRDAVRRLAYFDNTGALEMLDLHDPATRIRFAALSFDALMFELHAVDDRGRVYRGARGVNEILRRQRGPRRFAALLWYVPGVALISDRVYKFVAARRFSHRCVSVPT